jgi:hypothetical protein
LIRHKWHASQIENYDQSKFLIESIFAMCIHCWLIHSLMKPLWDFIISINSFLTSYLLYDNSAEWQHKCFPIERSILDCHQKAHTKSKQSQIQFDFVIIVWCLLDKPIKIITISSLSFSNRIEINWVNFNQTIKSHVNEWKNIDFA